MLVTDLDNTLYDWVTYFSRAFYAMVEQASKILEVPEERILDELRLVHRRFRDTETPFALLETEAVRERYRGLDRTEVAELMDPAFHRFSSARKQWLKLFPRVRETLEEIRASGVEIVAHTEAAVPTAAFRLSYLGIAEHFAALYASSLDGPPPPRQSALVNYPFAIKTLPRGENKPNPDVLRDICRSRGVSTAEAVFVGDSLVRDVGMAKQAGVFAVWAKYGTRYDRNDWQRIVRVTHWTDADVEKHQRFEQLFGASQPDAVLESNFSELLEVLSPRS